MPRWNKGLKVALSVRQPWAWFIIHAGKNIENRPWATDCFGRLFIHASGDFTRREYEAAVEFARRIGVTIPIPRYEELDRGGIIGEVELVGCVRASDSPWFTGRYGHVLTNPKPLEFIPCKGRLYYFQPEFEPVGSKPQRFEAEQLDLAL